jgi:glycosyltransferase involved in cell wall biosynthesis
LLVSNDLDTLTANYLASKFKRSCRLVYDTHEYYTEVPELQGRPFVKRFWERIEGWIFPKLNTIYTVNESIAGMYRKKYGTEVLVVRNVSPRWLPESIKTRAELGLPEESAEEAVEAIKDLENVLLLILGDGDAVPALKENVLSHQLSEKVWFLPKKPYAEMMQYTACADLGLTLDKPSNLNYRYSLPNKLFDYLHAGIPVICSDLPEVSRIVRTHEVGVVLNELKITELQKQIFDLQKNPEKLQRLKANCVNAAERECWENELATLKKIYPKVD